VRKVLSRDTGNSCPLWYSCTLYTNALNTEYRVPSCRTEYTCKEGAVARTSAFMLSRIRTMVDCSFLTINCPKMDGFVRVQISLSR
jgi:hypothetical protein